MPSNDSRKVVVRKNKFGRAVFAQKNIRKGERVAVFDGPIYDDLFDGWTDDILNHAIQIGPALWRDSLGIARYLNHSCEPNCGIKNRIEIVAMRDIGRGEEVTWDYEMTEKNPWWKMRCGCGTASCRKIIGNYKNMPRKVRAKYRGYISDWLLKGK